MWNNIGRKLQSLAKVLCWIGIIVSVIYAIVLWSQNSRYQSTFLAGLLTLVLGSLASWVGSWALYGLGLVVEYVENEGGLSSSANHEGFEFNAESSSVPRPFASQSPETEAEKRTETEAPEQQSENPDWPDDGDGFVRCPRCRKRMSIDFIKARRQCPDCGCAYAKENPLSSAR